MVTHDRYFLDSVCNRIVEIDKGKIYSYQANYSGYLELKTQRQEMETASERKRQSILRVELEWIQRGARARSTKQKARIQRYEELRDRENPAQDSQMELSSISTRMGKNDRGAGKYLQGLWRQKTDRGFFLYLFEGRQSWIYRTKRLWQVYSDENYCRYYSAGLRTGHYRTDCENGILCAGNSLRKK